MEKNLSKLGSNKGTIYGIEDILKVEEKTEYKAIEDCDIAVCSIDEILKNESRFYLGVKRVVDIVLSGLAILVSSPVFLIIAILIKLEDPKGPVFFCQNRNGKDLKVFKMYKFRSMVSNAEELLEGLMDRNEQDGPVFKISDDPRITKVGKFIRKTSLDELPQFINVLKGDMSIVGPRPPIPSEVEQYNEYQKQRLLVKPGITCIWQVSGRNSIGFDEWVEMDLEYIRNRSLLMDLKLMLKTARVLFGDKNAS